MINHSRNPDFPDNLMDVCFADPLKQSSTAHCQNWCCSLIIPATCECTVSQQKWESVRLYLLNRFVIVLKLIKMGFDTIEINLVWHTNYCTNNLVIKIVKPLRLIIRAIQTFQIIWWMFVSLIPWNNHLLHIVKTGAIVS